MSRNLPTSPIVTKLEGAEPGPTVVVMAGVHGNEVGGVRALEEARERMSMGRGVVYWVLANPGAIELDVRGVDGNLNRMFRPESELSSWERSSYERVLARELMPYLDECDAMLDLHSVYTSPATPFVICEENGYEIARKMPFEVVSSGWDPIHPGSTDGYVNNQGKIGMCVECGQHDEPGTKERALETIEVFLTGMGNIEAAEPLPDVKGQKLVRPEYIYRCKNDFIPKKTFPDFTPVKEGEVLGTDGGKIVKAPFTGLIIFVVDCDHAGQEAFVIGK
jgi:uncharacterized protein